MCFAFTKVLFHIHPGPEIHVSPPCKSRLTVIKVRRIASQLHADPISPLSRAQGVGLTFMQIPLHFILGAKYCISAPPRSHLTSIHVWTIASHLHLGPVSHQAPKIQIRVSPLSDVAYVVFHIALNVPVWGCLISIWWDEGSRQHLTHGWSAVYCIWEITSVCRVITHVCIILRRYPVIKRGFKYQHKNS